MTKKTAAAATETAAQTYLDQVKQTIDAVQSKIEVPAAAREFVQRATSTAKERAESVHEGASNVANSAEKLATSFVGGYANFTRGLIDAAFDNVRHTLETVEKVAAAKSASEAVQIQADFLRDNAKANYERLRGAAEAARTVVVDGAEQVRGELARFNPYAAKAA